MSNNWQAACELCESWSTSPSREKVEAWAKLHRQHGPGHKVVVWKPSAPSGKP